MSFNLIEKIGEPLRNYDGRHVKLATLSLCIKKDDAKIIFYDTDMSITDKYVNPYHWKFIWENAPMGADLFAAHVNDVYVIDDIQYYYVNILITDSFILSDYKDQLFIPEIIDWEDKLLPWRKFDHYSYKPVTRGAP